jgi:hypothetical protein
MKFVQYLSTAVVAGVLTAALTTSAAGGQDQSPTGGSPVVGLGGAGAFIPPAHVNGPFGAGGPLAGIGGAGAFIPSAELVAGMQRRLAPSA